MLQNLDEITAACEAATPGPWYEGFIDNDGEGPIPPEPSGEIFTAAEYEHDQEVCTCRLLGGDAQFIAKSREWVPELVAEVLQLRDALERSEAALEGTTLRYEEMKNSHGELIREKIPALLQELGMLKKERTAHTQPIPGEQWSEDEGDVLWWKFPVEEPPYCGSPLATDWPGYHTHWTRLVMPDWKEQEAAGGSDAE